jgi:hypothetical protein
MADSPKFVVKVKRNFDCACFIWRWNYGFKLSFIFCWLYSHYDTNLCQQKLACERTCKQHIKFTHLCCGYNLHQNTPDILIYVERILLFWLDNMVNVCNLRKCDRLQLVGHIWVVLWDLPWNSDIFIIIFWVNVTDFLCSLPCLQENENVLLFVSI